MSEADDRELWEAVEKHLVRYGGQFAPFLIERAQGSYVFDRDGRAILDFTSGQMCAILGHNHPEMLAAMEEAMKQVLHLFSGMLSPPVIELAVALAHMLPSELQKVLLVNTGSEANEAAMRLAKMFTGGFRGSRICRFLARHDRRLLVDHLLGRPQGVRTWDSGCHGVAGPQFVSLPDQTLPRSL